MKKFYIHRRDAGGIIHGPAKWWTNFKFGIDETAVPGEVLAEKYNATLVTTCDCYESVELWQDGGMIPYVVFNTEKDATYFMLRWS